MSTTSSDSGVNSSHRKSLTVEAMHPLHMIASGNAHRRFSTQAEADTQARLLEKYTTTSESQRDVYSAALADKLEDQEVNNLRKSIKEKDDSK